MLPGLAHAAAMWTAWYSDSPVIRTTVNFAHIAGLVVGGGAAIVEDRAMLAALRQDEDARRRRVEAQRLAHRMLTRAEHAAVRGEPRAWGRLRQSAVVSLALWFLTTLAGAALPNVG